MIQGGPEAQTIMLMAIFCGLALITDNQRYTASEHRGSILTDYTMPVQIYRIVVDFTVNCTKTKWEFCDTSETDTIIFLHKALQIIA